MKAKIITNPSSGRQTAQRLAEGIIKYLGQHQVLQDADFFWTKKAGDAEAAAAGLVPGQYDFVMAVGGDGTANEVVNGLLRAKSGLPLAVVAAGTMNDFAQSCGLPKTAAAYAKMIMKEKPTLIDVGQCNGRYFLNVAAVGVLADVAYKAPSDAKTAMGKLAYVLEAVKAAPQLLKTMPLVFETPQGKLELETLLFFASNSASVGGFRKIAPKASIIDGKLDICVFEKMPWNDLPIVLGQALIGEHVRHPNVHYFQASEMKVRSLTGADIPLDFDGEKWGFLPAEIRIVPQALPMFLPRSQRNI